MPERQQELPSKLWAAVQSSRGLAELVALLDSIDAHWRQGELGNADRLSLLRAGLGAIQTIASEDPTVAESTMVSRLLPLVLESAPDGDYNAENGLSNLRKLLADWIEKLPDDSRERVRQRVLGMLLDKLDGSEFAPACWTIGEIGYRDQRIVDRLWSIVEGESERRATALSTIVALGVPADTWQRLLQIIDAELRDDFPPRMRYVVQQLAASETAQHVLRAIERLSRDEKDHRLDLMIARSLLSRIVDASWGDHELQRQVWARLTQIAETKASGERGEFDLRSEVGPDCNAPDVIQYYLASLTEVLHQEGEKSRVPWFPLTKLNKCFRPLHMEGWRRAGSRADFVQALGALAQEDTKHDIGFVTMESRAKKDAWNHLLSLGAPQAADLVENALANETSPHVQSDVLECAACLAFSKLPPTVVRLITEEYNMQPDVNASPLAARIAATQLARSSATMEALETLMGFGLMHRGSPLLSSLDAIADVAVVLTAGGDKSIPSMMCSLALNTSVERRREGAVAALYALALAGQLDQEAVAPLMGIVRNEALPAYTRDRALEAIRFLPTSVIGNEDLTFILDLARGINETPESTRWRATELLISHKFLPGADYRDLLHGRLMLRQRGDTWLLEDGSPIEQWQGYSIALLWHNRPEAFVGALAEVIRRIDMFKIAPALKVVVYRPEAVDRDKALRPIADALVDRIKSRMTRGVAELALFGALGRLDPERLVGEPWDRFWINWLPDAQVAFADELGEASLKEPRSVDRAVSLLITLIGEGAYAVRRAAYHTMSLISSDALNTWCLRWANGSVDERRRAAEASGWSHERESDQQQTGVLAALLVDPEPSVREAANRAARERRNRLWADAYLDRVLAVRGNSNDEVLRNYCYGQALVAVGDDNHQRRLIEHLASPGLPPHVRHWLQQLIKGIEKQWEEITQKWPEPWLSWGGTVEELDGLLLFREVPPVEVHFSLWRKERASPSELSSWGGAVWSSSIQFQHALGVGNYLTLRIPGRKDATALMGRSTISSGASTSVVIFHGTGAYPDEEYNTDPVA